MSKTAEIVIERRQLSDLKPAPYNPRKIDERALTGLKRSIAEFGIVEPIIYNRKTGHVVGGHQRLKVLQSQGVEQTDVIVVDLDTGKEKALNVALNNPHITGEFTDDLTDLLDVIQQDDAELFDALLLDDLRDPVVEPLEDDEAPEPPANPVTELGDIWVLGDHRLRCGDSTNSDDVSAAMGGIEPFIMVTDPPYGVDYDPNWRVEAAEKGHLSYSARKTGVVQNDSRADWTETWALFPGAVSYVWHGGCRAHEVAESLAKCDFVIRTQIVWAKSHLAVSRGHYHWQHEPCWYAVRKGSTAKWTGDRKQSTIWNISRVIAEKEGGTNHGTQKPLECMARPIRNHGSPGDVVYDPFLGSGTTLIAAQELDRRCVGLELDPAYCDVIIERWQDRTGQKAIRQ